MRISLNTSKSQIVRWYDRVLAAFIYFTRLPFWRLRQPPYECYETVVEHWPLTGWLTAAAMAGTLYGCSLVAPYPVAVLLAITVRLLVTGAMHEDGLADFLDGFGGGGTDRQRILDIMKDSRIGTYGVIGLVLYFGLLFTSLLSLSPKVAAMAIFAADPFARMVTSELIIMMPYARTAATAKSRTVYRKPSVKAGISLAVQGLLPLAVFAWIMRQEVDWSLLVFPPCLVMYFLYLLIWRRLRGYTGDCCGAVCLLVELSFYLTLLFL